ncbi:putative leucine-rich repeat-containing protein DDB_G0290503 isoform X2 [Centruroides sculpturatus]|uniref:putative leucine-rich repeat-containing protein DDB_G0290503 isoform X2 n=1 Tax=Centruroides sculpturatus TaxID=218467 RepID=UPI000C6EB5AB|nr:putative leucine-rich repeat-containing protein DDB_G0290503 isoform X2 [Centruroides sculpturatus]
MMDINTALVCTAVFVFSAIMVYLISVFGMKERTYEEAIEEQRRRNQEASHHVKSDKSKKDKKFKKWRSRKEKSSEDEKLLEGSIELEHVNHHADFKTESTMMEDSDTEPKVKPKKRSKFFISKISSLNRDEATQLSSSTEETDDEQTTTFSKNFPENDTKKLINEQSDLEQLQLEKENEINGVQEEKTQKQQNCNRIAKQIDQSKTNETYNLTSSNKSSPVKKKKIRNDVAGVEKSDITGNKLLTLLKNASLNDDDIQMMIDVLLNKQSDSSEWTKKNDPVAVLKKHLQENESALETEQKLVQAANAKLKELRQDLIHEKSKATTNDRNLREKINQQQQELQNLHNRMQCTLEQHLSERSNLQSKLQQAEQIQKKLNEEHNITVQRLKDDKSQLQQALSRLETDQKRSSLEITRLQREVEQLLSTREQYETRQAAMQQAQDDLHHQIQQLEEHIQKLVSTHKEDEFSYKQHLTDMNNKFQQAESAKTALTQDLQNLQSICNSLESEGIKLRQRLEEAEHLAGSKTHELQQLQKTLEEAHKKHMELANCCDQLQSELLQMKNKENEQIEQIEDHQKENNKLTEELANAINEIEKLKLQQMDKIDLTEHTKILEEREVITNDLSQKLDDHKFQVNNLKDQLRKLTEENKKLLEEQNKVQEEIDAVKMNADKKVKESEIKADERIKMIQEAAEERAQEIQKEAEKCKIVQKSLEEANLKIATLQKNASEVDKKINEISIEASTKVSEAKANAEAKIEQILREAAEKYNEVHQDYEERLKEERATHKEEIGKLTLNLKEQQKAYSNMEDNFMIFRSEVDKMLDKTKKETENKMLEKQIDLENKVKEFQKIIDLKHNQINQLNEQSSELQKQRDRVSEILQRLFPDVCVNCKQYQDEWFVQFEEKSSNILNNYKKMINDQEIFISDSKKTGQVNVLESKEYNEKLEAQVLHYKKVLSETEDILNKLQTSVETEELTWENKLKAKDDLIKKIISEKEEMSRKILEEKNKDYKKMEHDLICLQNQIDFEKDTRDMMENNHEMEKKMLLDLQLEIKNELEEMKAVKSEKDKEISQINNELQQMKFQLEKEKKINNELSDQITNLNLLVKTSQDAIKVEQDLVKELQAQLCMNKNSSNGPTIQAEMPITANGSSNRK